jgi:putative acetyltransferase
MSELLIRPETSDDFAAVFAVNAAAFGQPAEAELVQRLRPVAAPAVSLVAVRAGRVVGHIFFSPVTIRGAESTSTAMGLAPMAVDPGCQRQGFGTRLVQQGLAACRALGEPVVFVLGHSRYYPRFGFRPAAPLGLRYAQPVPEEAFMVAELVPGALRGRTGVVSYLPAFDGL